MKKKVILLTSLIAVMLVMSASAVSASAPNEPSFTLINRFDGFNDKEGGPGNPGDRFGISATGDSDFDGDGFIDIIVGSPRADVKKRGENEGKVFVLSGKALLDGASLADAIIIEVDGEPTDNNTGELGFRQSVHSRDVTGDGVPDLLIGAWRADPVIGKKMTLVDAGTTFLYDGAMLLDGASQADSLLFRIDGEAGDRLGRPSMFVGDIDKDGVEDFFVGAHRAEVIVGTTTLFNAGKGFLISGGDLSILHVFEGAADNDFLGRSVMPLGDINKDGFLEIVIGASQGDGGAVSSIDGFPVTPGPGYVNVYSGKDFSLITTLLPPPEETKGGFGQASVYNTVSDLNSDFNKDNVPDILVGSAEAAAGLVGPPGDEDRPRTGRVYAFSGAEPYPILYIFDGEKARTATGAGFPTPDGRNEGDVFGDAVAVIDDMYGDGIPDIFGGAPRGDGIDPTPGDGFNELTDSGYAKLFSGKDGSLLARFDGAGIRTNMGHHVIGALDIDKNGLLDVLIGSDLTDFGGTNAGSLFWYTLVSPGEGTFLEGELVGLPENMTASTGVLLRGVAGGGAPWVVADSDVNLQEDGKLLVKVKGLLITKPGNPADGTTGPFDKVVASLTCEGHGIVDTSEATKFTNMGNANIMDMITLLPSTSSTCVDPIILVRGVFDSGEIGPWIAATSFAGSG